MYEWYSDSHMSKHHIHPDTEPAYVVRPCPPEPSEDCVCVTEADVDMWNEISALSGLTGVDLSSLSALKDIQNSANYWNGTYKTVKANSAQWDNNNSAIKQLEENSEVWDTVSNLVTSNSSHWNKAYNTITQVDVNKEHITELSAELEKHIKLYFDMKDSFEGDGTSASPYKVKQYKEYKSLVNNINSNLEKLFKDGKQNWITLDAQDDTNGINPYIKSLFRSVAEKDTDQDSTLITHGKLIKWLIKNTSGGSGDTIKYELISSPQDKSELTPFSAKNTIYYSI